MFALIYRSTATLGFDVGEVQRMLDRARVNNHINEITGCLLYHNGCFLQLIEGNEEDVRNLFSNIENDDRHMDVEVLYTEKIHERMFSSWSMLFTNLEDDRDDGGEKLRLFNELFHSSGIPAAPNRSKFVLWEHVHGIVSSDCIDSERLRAG